MARRTILLIPLALLAASTPAAAEIVSFDTDYWDHGSGSQLGWNDTELTGTTTLSEGTTLTITSTDFGSASHTGNHMARLSASYFTGFAFQMVPSTTNNSGSLSNYLRLDFEFSSPVVIDSFTLTDVDRGSGQWWDVLAVEGFSGSLGSVGSGQSANYTFDSPTNEQLVTRFGLSAVRPRPGTGNVQNTPPADVSFDFSAPVSTFSIYYWNESSSHDSASTQTIGIRGNEFEVTPVPEPASLLMCLIAAGIALLIPRESFGPSIAKRPAAQGSSLGLCGRPDNTTGGEM